jgi:hypothetical protein
MASVRDALRGRVGLRQVKPQRAARFCQNRRVRGAGAPLVKADRQGKRPVADALQEGGAVCFEIGGSGVHPACLAAISGANQPVIDRCPKAIDRDRGDGDTVMRLIKLTHHGEEVRGGLNEACIR